MILFLVSPFHFMVTLFEALLLGSLVFVLFDSLVAARFAFAALLRVAIFLVLLEAFLLFRFRRLT